MLCSQSFLMWMFDFLLPSHHFSCEGSDYLFFYLHSIFAVKVSIFLPCFYFFYLDSFLWYECSNLLYTQSNSGIRATVTIIRVHWNPFFIVRICSGVLSYIQKGNWIYETHTKILKVFSMVLIVSKSISFLIFES